ncbi:MAG: PAS domain S-box protein, partial [Flavitalea sp.]
MKENQLATAIKELAYQIEAKEKLAKELVVAHEEIKKVAELLKYNSKEISDYKNALDESFIIAITNQKGIIEKVNKKFCLISKYSKEELIGQDHRIINSGYHSKEFMRD